MIFFLLFGLLLLCCATLLPALVIFFVLDRYRPGRYSPRNRGIRLLLYFIVLSIISRLLYEPQIHLPWLLSVLVFWFVPFPVYYVLRRIF